MTEISHADIARKVESLTEKVADMESAMAKMGEDAAKTRELVEAFSAVQHGFRFFKGLAGLATSLAILWVAFKGGAQLLVELGKPPL